MRTGFYIDGFNLYHAIDALGDNELKWLNLKSLAQSYLREEDVEVKTAYFTAINSWDATKRARHVAYVAALEAFGVTVQKSNFDKVSKFCHRHNRFCPMREEKQTDVALGVTMLADCYQLGLERVVLMTADSDQIPSVKAIKSAFPGTILYLVAPPKRLSVARQLGGVCDGVAELTASRIREHLLPEVIKDGRGRLIAQRPALYGGVTQASIC